jgi:hypothetical protein
MKTNRNGPDLSCAGGKRRQAEGRSAFLKKRSKKLFSVLASACPETLSPGSQKFFGSFFQKRTASFVLN